VEVRYWKQLGLPLYEPLSARRALALRTMAIATGVVSDMRCAAVVALFDMAAERRCSALRNGAHHAPLDSAKMMSTCLTKRFAVAAEHIRHL
jgi:hypothetical protein